MPKISEFHSVNEVKKPVEKRVHHNNKLCRAGLDIPANEQRVGTGGYRLCDDCIKLNKDNK